MTDSKRSFLLVFLIGTLAFSCSHKPVDSTSTPPSTAVSPAKVAPPKSAPSGLALVPRGIDFGKVPEVVTFGSCANQDEPQPIWNTIAGHNPDLFIFMGDNIYSSSAKQKPAAEQYKKLSKIPEYRAFREKVPIMATWDDHDYGQGDGGADNPEKEAYKREFLRHFPYVKDSISWNQGGIYHVKYIGGDITEKKRRRKITKKQPLLQVIVLDTRYFRSPLKPSATPEDPLKRYEPWPESDKTKTILGEEQWAWLEEQLKRPADLRFIVSSIQVIANDPTFEKWGNFPAERQRLFELLKSTGVRNAVILSGDRHRGAIAKYDIKGLGPIFDITSSAINVTRTEPESDPNYIGPVVLKDNFGVARIDWKARRVKFELRDSADQIANSVDFKF